MTTMISSQMSAFTSSTQASSANVAHVEPSKPPPPTSSASVQSHANWLIQASTSVEPSSPGSRESPCGAGFTAQSVSAMTACPSGLRNGARSHCMAKRSRNA
jgi:predicted component of type VI protein secretion system